MAQKVIVTNVDDLDGTEGDDVSTHHFALGKQVFKIDLTSANYEGLRKVLDPYISNAQTADPEYRRAVSSVNSTAHQGTGRTTHVPAPRNRASRERGAAIRKWAHEQGIKMGDRGRIPRDVEQKYDAAHPF